MRENKIRAVQQAKEVPAKLGLTLVLFIGFIFLFGFIAREVFFAKTGSFDQSVFSSLQPYLTPERVRFMEGISFFGSSYFLLPAYCLLIGVLLLIKKSRWALDIAIVAISSTLILNLLKIIFRRHRPDLPLVHTLNNYSFPSGHSLSSFVFAAAIIYLIWKEKLRLPIRWVLSIFLFLLALGIGFSRIFLRYHYASDVIAGFFLGAAWVSLSLWLQNRIHRNLKKKQSSAV